MNEYAKLSAEDLADQLGLTVEEAKALKKSWGYEPPTDPEQLKVHANKAVRYEYLMRGLNTDLSTGRITQDEYDQKEAEIYSNIYG